MDKNHCVRQGTKCASRSVLHKVQSRGALQSTSILDLMMSTLSAHDSIKMMVIVVKVMVMGMVMGMVMVKVMMMIMITIIADPDTKMGYIYRTSNLALLHLKGDVPSFHNYSGMSG